MSLQKEVNALKKSIVELKRQVDEGAVREAEAEVDDSEEVGGSRTVNAREAGG